MEVNVRLKGIYNGIKQRCYNSNNPNYPNYGGRGVRVSDEWLDSYTAFENWALSNGYNDNLTIDRINVNGDYEPGNCRWADLKVQSNNKRHYWLPENCDDFTYDEAPNPDMIRSKFEEIKHRLRKYNLSQVWLINQLAMRGLQTDKTEMSSVLSGTRVGAKSEYILNLSIEVLDHYYNNFVKLYNE